MKVFLLLVLILGCSHVVTVEKFTLVKCGYLLETENGTWSKDQTLLLEDGIIFERNPKIIPAAATIVDYSDKYIIPGLIDAHTHVFLEDPTMGDDFSKGLLSFIKNTTDEERMEIGKKRLLSLQHSGFTSVRDLGNQGQVDVLNLKVKGSRLYSSGPGFSPRWGQFPPGTPEEILRKEYLNMNQDPPVIFPYPLIKLYADEEPNTTITDLNLLRKWVDWAHKHSLKVAAHAILKKGISAALLANVDTIEHGTEATPGQLKGMAERNIILVPTYSCKLIKSSGNLNVETAFGSDNYFSREKEGIVFGEATLEMLIAFQKCGLSGGEILRMATISAAKTLGMEKKIGQLNRGAFADFIVMNKNPEKDLNELKFPVAIFQNGMKVR